MFDAFLRTWAQAAVRDVLLALAGFVVIALALLFLGRRRLIRELTNDHLMVAGTAVALLAIVALAIYNRSTGV